MIQIEYFDSSSGWRVYGTTTDIPQQIQSAMQEAARHNPGCRIRAVTMQGVIVDFLT